MMQTGPPFLVSVSLLKTTILKAIQNAVKNFEEETGVTPSTIEVNTVEMTTHGDRVKRFIASSVDVGFNV